MASFQLFFSPRSIESFESIIRPVSEELTILEARLLGRADDLEGGFDSAAVHFTDLIGWDIKSLGSEDYQLWVDAAVNLRFARDVNDMWADYVKDFWDTRNEIWDDWDAAVEAKVAQVPAKYQGTTITSTVPDPAHWFDSDAKKCRELYDELSEYLEEIKEREQANWDKHEENAIEISGMLLQGPTDVNVQKLIDGGYANMAYANLDPDKYLFLESDFDLSPESAEQTADELAPYWSGERPLDDRYHELMLVMSMIGTNARTAQNDGKLLDSEEMAFLDAFYERLESENTPGSGVLGVPAQMEGGHMTDEEREYALGVLGDGLLALSDESLGGGHGDLPRSVRRVAESPQYYEHGDDEVPYSWVLYENDVRALSSMLRHADEDFQGGYEFSVHLSMSSGTYTHRIGEDGFLTSEEMAPLVDVSTRNEDANYYILTGEHLHADPYASHPALGTNQFETGVDYSKLDIYHTSEDRSNVVEGLFTYEWHDKGEAVSQLIDWISDNAGSDDPELQDMAGTAAASFIDMVTTAEMQEALTDTGVDFNEDGKDYKSASFTAFNTELADSLADVFDSYIFSFAESSVSEINEDGEEIATIGVGDYISESNRFNIGPQERAAYMEYLMGNDDTAARTINSAATYQTLAIEDLLSSGNTSTAARGSASLNALIEIALDAEAEKRSLDLTETKERKEKLYKYAIEKAAEHSDKIPVIGNSISWGLNLGPDWIVEKLVDQETTVKPRLPSGDNAETRARQNELILLEQIMNSQSENIEQKPPKHLIETLMEADVCTINSDGDLELDPSSELWQDNSRPEGDFLELDDILAGALENTEINPTDPRTERKSTDALALAEEYSEEYNNRYDLVKDFGKR